MKKYFAVWEVYSNDWKLVEKGYHFFFVESVEDLLIEMDNFCDASAEARGLDSINFTISSCQPV